MTKFQKLIMLDRYSQRGGEFKNGSECIVTTEKHEKFPKREIGVIRNIDSNIVTVELESGEHRKYNKEEVVVPTETTWEEISKRVANGLSNNGDEFYSFYDAIVDKDFVPAGRVLHGAGTGKKVSMYNCYVMPNIPDSRKGISRHREKVIEIMSRGGGVGTNISCLRPKMTKIKGVVGHSSGSIGWANDLALSTHLISQGGSRKGAQMLMMGDWHPDIIEFVTCKIQKSSGKDLISELQEEFPHFNIEQKHNDFMTGANISVAISDKFMNAVENDLEWELRFPDVDNYSDEEMEVYNKHWTDTLNVFEWEKMGYGVKTYEIIKARDLWKLINMAAQGSAEPGIFFLERADELSNAKMYGQKVVCTNPCGEQPLAPWSVCNLANINLSRMEENGEVNWAKLRKTIRTQITMQDNVIDKTYYFLEENERQAFNERRIGCGFLGLHDLFIKLGIRYGSEKSIKLASKITNFIANEAYQQSSRLAKKKGSFPLYNETAMLNSPFIKKLNAKTRGMIIENGLRNSHLLSIQPTGTTGSFVEAATGLEPYFGFNYYRSGGLGESVLIESLILKEWREKNPNAKEIPEYFNTAMSIPYSEHIAIQCAIQEWIDASISKTINMPKGSTVEEVSNAYLELYRGGAKGGTVYVDGSRDVQILNNATDDKEKEKVEEELCPLCQGETIISGGCTTCKNCGTQTKCGI